jgi:hypothetical protein
MDMGHLVATLKVDAVEVVSTVVFLAYLYRIMKEELTKLLGE